MNAGIDSACACKRAVGMLPAAVHVEILAPSVLAHVPIS